MRILIFGSSGQIGTNLALRLLAVKVPHALKPHHQAEGLKVMQRKRCGGCSTSPGPVVVAAPVVAASPHGCST